MASSVVSLTCTSRFHGSTEFFFGSNFIKIQKMDKVFDVSNEDEILKKVNLLMHGLNEGLHALAIDFGISYR